MVALVTRWTGKLRNGTAGDEWRGRLVQGEPWRRQLRFEAVRQVARRDVRMDEAVTGALWTGRKGGA